MIRINIIGAGRVAQALMKAFSSQEKLQVNGYFSRNPKSALSDFPFFKSIQEMPEADVWMLCVPDDVIERLSEQIPKGRHVVIHTAGSQPIEKLGKHAKRGVMYPLQSFDSTTRLDEVPFFLEASDADTLQKLKDLTKMLSNSVHELDYKSRLNLHLAAVFVNNFSNAMMDIAHQLCERNKLDFNVLRPLIQQSFSRLLTHEPKAVQTGPAIRGDVETIKKHLKLLKKLETEPLSDEYAAVYRAVTRYLLLRFEPENYQTFDEL